MFSAPRGTAAALQAANPAIPAGVQIVESDTGKAKRGDGVKTWNQLPYEFVRPQDIADLGGGDMVADEYATNGTPGYVDNAKSADKAEKLATQRSISLTGDITGSANFDGSANASIVATLANSGVTAGTHTKVTVDAKGRVTGGSALAANDIPNMTLAKITDSGTAASKNAGTSSGNVPVLGPDGKLPSSVFPALPAGKTHVIANQTAMLALSDAVIGDCALRTDSNELFVLAAFPASTLANWVHVTDEGVKSTNGKTGPNITLDTDDIVEGSANKYYTEGRFNSSFAAKSSSELSDGATILRSNDTLIFDGGVITAP
jgi:hypothetical protein